MESDLGKLFIGGISWDTTEDRLREYFGGFGEVVEAVIMKDRTTGRARGFGFIVFADPVIAERVVLDKHMIDGRMVEAKKAVPRDDQSIINRNNSSMQGSPGPGRTKKIFVGGLPSTITEADFKKYFDQFGTITDVVVMYDHNTQRPRGFGFITYDSEDSVDKVLVKTFHELNGKLVEVKRAVPKELSPGPHMRSPVGGYNYGLNRANSFLNGYTQGGYTPSSIGSYGMRIDGRFGPLAVGRNNFTSFTPGYGIGMNFEPGIDPSYGGSSVFGNGIGYGQTLSPYYSGNSNRLSSPIDYGASNRNTTSIFNSVARSLWGSGGLNYLTNSASSNAFMTSGSGNLGGFGNNSLGWGGSSSPASNHDFASGSEYSSASLGYGSRDNSFGLGATNYRRNTGAASVNIPLPGSGSGYEGNLADPYITSSINGDTTWRPQSSVLDGSGPFGYGLGDAASDVIKKDSSDHMGGYSFNSRQPNRGIAA